MSDLIKRSDAINSIYKLKKTVIKHDVLNYHDGLFDALEVVQNLPSTDKPQGKWIIEIDTNGNTYGRCSICGMKQYAGQLNFCPDCGAKMKGIDDE